MPTTARAMTFTGARFMKWEIFCSSPVSWTVSWTKRKKSIRKMRVKMEAFRTRRFRWLLAAAIVLACTPLPSLISSAATRNQASSLTLSTLLVLDSDHEKIVKYTVQSDESFYATVDHGQGHTAASSGFDSKTKKHYVGITVLLDHIDSRQCVKELLRVGNVGGPSVMPVLENDSLVKEAKIFRPQGNYSFDQPVHLLKWNDRRYQLTVER